MGGAGSSANAEPPSGKENITKSTKLVMVVEGLRSCFMTVISLPFLPVLKVGSASVHVRLKLYISIAEVDGDVQIIIPSAQIVVSGLDCEIQPPDLALR